MLFILQVSILSEQTYGSRQQLTMVGVQWTSNLSQVRLVTSGKKWSNVTNKNILIKI